MKEYLTNDFIQYWLICKKSFNVFLRGERYWLEKVSEDIYNVRSDNALGQYVRITNEQMFDNFERTDELVFGM